MPRVRGRSVSSVLSALGLTQEQEHLYHRVLALSGSSVAAVTEALAVAPEELDNALSVLLERGIATIHEDHIHVLPLSAVIGHSISREAEVANRAHDRLLDLAAAVQFLTSAATRPGPGQVEHVLPLDGEVSSGGNPLQLLTTMIEETTGDLLWLRPDAWRMPRESAMAKVVAEAVSSGRRSRAIYPVRALHEAPDTLRARAQGGEQVRVISDLPTRLFVIGNTHAVLPEPLGFADEPRLLVRQPALVESLILLFELMWDRAAPVPDLDLGEARPDLRRFLLQQLAAGAKDEQIARVLGISLRTVRRRVASLLIELGVDNRFQAGVEAVRRGWL
jgi:DNA-binding CsgD family transcriptional regulator